MKDIRTFGTFTAELLALSDWLRAGGITHVAMESTGIYWRPLFNILEGDFALLLVNAQHIKYVPGRKTDVKSTGYSSPATFQRHRNGRSASCSSTVNI